MISDDDTNLPGEPFAGPIPPALAETFGYRGSARVVGFSWSSLGDELTYSDGASSGSAQSWAYLAYKRHRAVRDHLADYDLGSSEEEAKHMLLIDREKGRASVAPVGEAREFLESQWPEQAPMTPEEQEAVTREFTKLVEEMRNQPIDWDAITRQQREQSTRLAVMLAFLDQQVSASQGEGHTP